MFEGIGPVIDPAKVAEVLDEAITIEAANGYPPRHVSLELRVEWLAAASLRLRADGMARWFGQKPPIM